MGGVCVEKKHNRNPLTTFDVKGELYVRRLAAPTDKTDASGPWWRTLIFFSL